jgi:L-arabinose isomerase
MQREPGLGRGGRSAGGGIHERYVVAENLRAGGDRRAALREAAAIELGMRAFLESGGFHAFSDTFQDLHGLGQIPGIAVQRLMEDGYGFGAEGDCKTAALDHGAACLDVGAEIVLRLRRVPLENLTDSLAQFLGIPVRP